MKVTTYIVRFLKSKGIDTVFELQGGMITRIVDELHRQGGFNIVSMHHEQAAAFAADAFARISNKPGIALATSGPGATNLITGIGNCYFDSIPAIFITGQVNLNEQKGEKNIRQLGFQETDIVSVVNPLTKAAFAVNSASGIPETFEKAWDIAMTGRKGPVLIDIPMNLQKEEIDLVENMTTPPFSPKSDNRIPEFITSWTEVLKKSRKPLVLAGNGVRISGTQPAFLNFIERFNLPVVSSLLGLDSIPFNHPNRVGFIGTYGNRWANYSLGSCDLLLVLGSRLDLRQTGSDIDSFKKSKTIFHVDIEESELNNRITDCIILNADLHDFFEFANKAEPLRTNTADWKTEIEKKRLELTDTEELKNIQGINPNRFIHQLSYFSKLAKVFTTDVGNNQMWAAQSLELIAGQRFLSSGGMGSMGYSLPAAIGASFAMPDSPIVCMAGDGGFQINIQELQTIRRNNLPIKIVILNNHCLGMIRQFQDSYFDSCYQSTVWGYNAPNFALVTKAYGISSCSIENIEDIETGLSKLWENPMEPFLLDVNINLHTNVYPKMMFGSPITEMEPKMKKS